MSANQPTAAWSGPGDPLVVVAGHLVSPQDGFGEIGRMPNGNLRRPNRMSVGVGGIASIGNETITRFGTNAALFLRRANGTEAAPSAVLSGEALGGVFFSGFGATAFSGARASLISAAAENWTDVAQGTELQLATVPIGGTGRTIRWVVQAPGHLVAATDDVVDIGVSGANRPRSIFIGTGGIHAQVIGEISRFGVSNPSMQLRFARGTEAVPTAVLNNNFLGTYEIAGHDGTDFAVGGRIAALASENWAVGAHGTRVTLASTPIGSAVLTDRWIVQAPGHLVAAVDNAVDIGASGANRPRDIHIARNVFIAGNLSILGSFNRVVLAVDGANLLTIGEPDIANMTLGLNSGTFTIPAGVGLILADIDAAAITAGVNDSGGAGFRLLRVPN